MDNLLEDGDHSGHNQNLINAGVTKSDNDLSPQGHLGVTVTQSPGHVMGTPSEEEVTLSGDQSMFNNQSDENRPEVHLGGRQPITNEHNGLTNSTVDDEDTVSCVQSFFDAFRYSLLLFSCCGNCFFFIWPF